MVTKSFTCTVVPINTVSANCERNGGTGDKIYDYEDALAMTGNGWYNRGLLLALSIGLLAMGVDVFGFSIVVTGCSCDFQLEVWQKGILLSMPFIGPIVMSIPWGYISDTQGRRWTLLIALWGAFLSSFISAFSINWIMLAVLKVSSSMFAVQSGAYALLGESCASSIRDFYMLIMTSVLMLYMVSYIVPGYFILQHTFALSLGFLTFTPWRLLVIVMASPLFFSAVLLHFYYESPKFLVNAGQEHQALEYLRKIWMRNGGNQGEYPVRRVVLKDNSKARDNTIPILTSLWRQTIPLFKPPLLWKTMHLFFITAVIYSINNCWVMWMPSIVEAFNAGIASNTDDSSRSLCSIISSISENKSNVSSVYDAATCSSFIQSRTLLSGITHGVVFAGITLGVSKLASRKKVLMILFLLIPMLSSVGAVFNQDHVASLLLYVGTMMTNLCMGVLFAYYVEMYPTSYRGMAACLGVMVARISGVSGVNLLGAFVMTHCTLTFYATGAILLAGIVVAACFLPPDRTKNSV